MIIKNERIISIGEKIFRFIQIKLIGLVKGITPKIHDGNIGVGLNPTTTSV
jgi:hypothetical protein